MDDDIKAKIYLLNGYTITHSHKNILLVPQESEGKLQGSKVRKRQRERKNHKLKLKKRVSKKENWSYSEGNDDLRY